MNVTSYVVIPVVPAASASASSELAVSSEVIMQELTTTMTMQTKLLSTINVKKLVSLKHGVRAINQT